MVRAKKSRRFTRGLKLQVLLGLFLGFQFVLVIGLCVRYQKIERKTDFHDEVFKHLGAKVKQVEAVLDRFIN